MRGRQRVFGAVALCAVLVAGACGNSPGTGEASGNGSASNGSSGSNGSGGSTPGGTTPAADLTKNVPITATGVTDTEIHVGGVVSKTNPLGGEYDQAFYGVEAYFDMINEKGGIYGRQLKLTSKRDDQLVNNLAEVQALISQDEVFAVMPIANIASISGAQLLADERVPAFGWNVNAEWAGPDNLFGEKGSYLCFTCAQAAMPYVAKQLGAKRAAVLGYSVQQSHDCAVGVEDSLKKWPTAEVVYRDTQIPFSFTPDFSVQVAKIKETKADYIITCMDDNGVIGVAKEMKKADISAPFYLPNGYNHETIGAFGDLLEGSVVGVGTVPFEAQQIPAAEQEYLRRIEKVGGKKGELSLAGWLNADLFYKGLVAAGPEFDREKLIAAINKMTDWDADGIGPGVDWTHAHTATDSEQCTSFAKIENKAFVPQWGEPGKPFVCFDKDDPQAPDHPVARA